MAEAAGQNKSVDLSAIQDPVIRRVFREYHEQTMAIIGRQQLQIEALLEAMIDKHVTSIGEFKRQMQKLQSQSLSSSRLHEAVLSAIAPPAPAAAPAKPPASRS